MSRPSTTDAPGPSEGEACVDILARINEREREIERILRNAHESAATTIAEARRTADELIATRRTEADRLAALAGDGVVAHAHREADAIVEAAALDAASVQATPSERIESAAASMLVVVLPAPPGAGGAP